MIKGNCANCQEEFYAKEKRKKFCNQSCAAKFNNRLRIKRPRCLKCSNTVRNKSGYCTLQCRQDHEIERWLAGELDGSMKYTHAGYVRRYLERKSGNACELCGFSKTKENGSSILQVDHIDGDWRNNKPENVRLLCPNCHCLTDTWGAGNMGNGRKWKSKYKQFGDCSV